MGPDSGVYVTKFAPHEALRLIAGGKLTFDERVVVHRVGGEGRKNNNFAEM